MQDLCQDQLFFKKLDFSMLLLGSSSSHCTVLLEKSEQGGLGEVTRGVQSCPPDEGLEWDAAAAGRQVQALDLGREGEVVRGARRRNTSDGV